MLNRNNLHFPGTPRATFSKGKAASVSKPSTRREDAVAPVRTAGRSSSTATPSEPPKSHQPDVSSTSGKINNREIVELPTLPDTGQRLYP